MHIIFSGKIYWSTQIVYTNTVNKFYASLPMIDEKNEKILSIYLSLNLKFWEIIFCYDFLVQWQWLLVLVLHLRAPHKIDTHKVAIFWSGGFTWLPLNLHVNSYPPGRPSPLTSKARSPSAAPPPKLLGPLSATLPPRSQLGTAHL